MTDDNVKYLEIDYKDHSDCVVDKVNHLLQDYGLVFEEDDNKNEEAADNCDPRMWWRLKDLTNEF